MTINPEQIPGCTVEPGFKIFEKNHLLTAGETDSRGLMPVQLIASRVIEAATDHSNLLGIGYADLAKLNLRWVLVRLSIEVDRSLAINESYKIATWIESVNRFFSDRGSMITDKDEKIVARIHSVWAAIDNDTRLLGNLEQLPKDGFTIVEPKFKLDKLAPPAIDINSEIAERTLKFGVTDIDFNRHVNAIRYLTAAIDSHDLRFYDSHSIGRLDASFEHEVYYGEEISVASGTDANVNFADTTVLTRPDGKRAAAIRLLWHNL